MALLSAYTHDDVMIWKPVSLYCPSFCEGIQWSLDIVVRVSSAELLRPNSLINSRFAGDLRHPHCHIISLQWAWHHLFLYTFNNRVVSNVKNLLPITYPLKYFTIHMALIDETQACEIHLHSNRIYWTCSGRSILSYSVIHNWLLPAMLVGSQKHNFTLMYLGDISTFLTCVYVL